MHEYSIVAALVDRVAREADARGARVVRRLHVSVGELAGVEPILLATAYETFRAGTVCAAADLEVGLVEARWSCPRCGDEIARGKPLRCPTCGGPARLAAGDDIVLERIEMEVD